MNDQLLEESSDQDFPWSKMSNRDLALGFIHEPNLEAQLIAIRSSLVRNQQADAAAAAEIKKLEEQIRANTGDLHEWYLDEWVDAMHGTVFQDAAHSMAAVGMLAPFVESLFVAIFRHLREHTQDTDNVPRDDPRTAVSQNKFWDPHFVFHQGKRQRDLVAGIGQLARTTGLADYMPSGYDTMLSALFAYRNVMFHCGFEWPIEERKDFDTHIKSKGWPTEWFQKVTTNGDPWIFYMSDKFIRHCLATIDGVLEGVGAYLNNHMGKD